MNKSAKMSQGTNQNEIWDFGQDELSENPPEALSSLKQQMLEKGIHLLIQSYISFLSNEKLDKCDFWIKICSNTFLSLLRPTTLLELFKWSLFHKILRIYQISSNFNKQRNTKNKNTKKQFYGKGPACNLLCSNYKNTFLATHIPQVKKIFFQNWAIPNSFSVYSHNLQFTAFEAEACIDHLNQIKYSKSRIGHFAHFFNYGMGYLSHCCPVSKRHMQLQNALVYWHKTCSSVTVFEP